VIITIGMAPSSAKAAPVVRFAGQPPVRRRHEGCGLLVPGHDQLDPGAAQRFDDVQVLFARNAENLLDTLILQSGDEQVGTFHGLHSSLCARSRLPTIRGPVEPAGCTHRYDLQI
jgi:hypothetical protein